MGSITLTKRARQSEEELRIAAIGLGWATTHRHLPWLYRCPQASVVGAIDRTPANVERARRRFPKLRLAVAEHGQSVDWMDQVDAVTVGTDPSSHYEIAKSFLLAGKHVLLEKPMAMSVQEGYDLAEIAQSKERILALVHNFQFARSMRELSVLIERGRVGEIRSIWAFQLSNHARRLPSWYEELPLGLFYDESPHMFYLTRAILKDAPEFVSAEIVDSPHGWSTPALVTILLRSGAVPIQLSMNFEAPLSEWQVVVLGSECLAMVDIFRDLLVVARNDGQHRARDIISTSLQAIRTHVAGTIRSGANHLLGRLAYGNDEVIARFVGACLTGVQPKGISAADGIRVLEMQHEVLQSPHIKLDHA